MSDVTVQSVVVKAEADFYAALETSPIEDWTRTRGIRKYREGSALYLEIAPAILDPTSLFVRYLNLKSSCKVFGKLNPLYSASILKYVGENPMRVNHFTTRLLLAFF
jgi:hypothetical protein